MRTLFFLATEAVPTVEDLAESLMPLASLAALAASLGFSIWLYRWIKKIAGDSLGGGAADHMPYHESDEDVPF